jgi:hypothetical protein
MSAPVSSVSGHDLKYHSDRSLATGPSSPQTERRVTSLTPRSKLLAAGCQDASVATSNDAEGVHQLWVKTCHGQAVVLRHAFNPNPFCDAETAFELAAHPRRMTGTTTAP